MFEQMVQCLNNGEKKMPKKENKPKVEDDDQIEFDSSELLLGDGASKESKIYKIDKLKFEIGPDDIQDENVDDNSDKYRQYMSWVP